MTHELNQSLRIHELESQNMALRARVHYLEAEVLITEVERRLQAARPHAFNRRALGATVNRCIAEGSPIVTEVTE